VPLLLKEQGVKTTPGKNSGGRDRTRTCDLLRVKQAGSCKSQITQQIFSH